MCADDIVCHGGRPLLFLDYLAVGRLHPDRVATIVAGIAAACEAIGCRLVGGETAEHPGLMDPDAFDLAGFCLGVVERSRLLDGSGARTGDAVLGLASSGLHANGYSLVRALVGEGRLDLDAAVDGRSLGDALLEPTRLYAPAVLSLLDVARDEGWRVGGVAHITGGGLPGNLPRAVGPSLGIAVDPASWPEPRVIGAVREAAGMGAPETRATFNGGIGMAVVVDAAATGRAISLLEASGHAAWRIGGVVDAAEASLSRYAEVA
jgi:phosphoribosylformylglycinamidine cyclo-ligase